MLRNQSRTYRAGREVGCSMNAKPCVGLFPRRRFAVASGSRMTSRTEHDMGMDRLLESASERPVMM